MALSLVRRRTLNEDFTRTYRNACFIASLLIAIVSGASFVSYADDPTENARMELIKIIEQDVRQTSRELGKTELDPRVMKAIATVPRHEFVPPEEESSAYENRPLPIGNGQTISQPYIVAIMTDMLNLKPDSKVLELGTGSGYQAAILSKLAGEVLTIDRKSVG